MNVLKAGFSRVDITPPLGANLAGHPHPETRLGTEMRFASGVSASDSAAAQPDAGLQRSSRLSTL